MRFIFLTLGYHPDQIGGAFRYVAETAERLANRGHEVHAIYPAAPNGETGAALLNGVVRHRFANADRNFAANWRAENRAASAELAGLVETATPTLVVNCHAYFGPTQRAARGPTAFLFTGPWAEEFLFSRQTATKGFGRRAFERTVAAVMRRVERSALRRARRLLTISDYYVAALRTWHPGPLPPIRMVSGGTDFVRFQPDAERLAFRRSRGLRDEDFLLLTVRRLDARMGLPLLLEAFATIAPEFPRARLWLAGRGPQEAELRAAGERLGLAGRIGFLGFVPEAELPRVYAAADVTLMPSLDLEGFGLATVESLACGTPVLGSRAGATPELLSPLDPALLFAPGSPEALAQRLRDVLAGRVSLPARERCAAYARTQFSWDRPADGLEQAFRELRGGAA
jgi:glycosyltransferase involved in cell wall biosynthesis